MNPHDSVTLYFVACALMVIGMAVLSLIAGVPARRVGWSSFVTGAFLLIFVVIDILARTYLDP